jgi:hypothetical protein
VTKHGEDEGEESVVLEFVKTESIVTVQRRFQTQYDTGPPMDKKIREWHKKFQQTGCLCVELLSGANKGQHIARTGNCRYLSKTSGAFCANVFSRKDTGCKRSTVSAGLFVWQAHAATMLEFLVPLTNSFVHRWSCVVLCLKPTLYRHN